MTAPRRAVKLRTAPRRAAPDTSRKLKVEASSFVHNEWLETLSRVKADQPRRYAKEVSAGLQMTVSKYEQLKAEHGRRTPARVEEGREAGGDTTRQQVESLRRERPPRPVKTNKKKPKRGGIGAPRLSRSQGTF